MRPFRGRRKSEEPTEAEVARGEAEVALRADMQRLEETRARTPHHRALGARILQLYQENHFRQSIRHSLGGKQ